MPRHLTQEERDRIALLSHQGYDQQEIARALGRNASTISRELYRNRTGECYLPGQAQQMAVQRRQERPLTRKLDDAELNHAVRRGLARDWSPEQIAGRLRAHHPDDPKQHISHQTIYDWIEEDPNRDHWKSHLRKRGRRPARQKNEEKTASPHASVKDRTEVIELRIRLGDWEGDTVLGPPGTGGIVTLVDRKSRYTIMTKIKAKDSEHVHARIKQRLRELIEEQRHSLTFDNGTEFARCHRLEKHLGMTLYFAEPGCPYQRGTNENTNGLIRQYFPKGTDFRNVSHHEVRRVEALLNDRPRQCLGFRTPNEVFSMESTMINCD